MKLSNRTEAYIAPAKLKEYLLSEIHPIGTSKAKFCRSFSFDETNVDMLKQGLTAIAQVEDVTEAETSPHGTKYVIQGELQTPAGRAIRVDTVWMIDTEQEQPRLVTAFPA